MSPYHTDFQHCVRCLGNLTFSPPRIHMPVDFCMETRMRMFEVFPCDILIPPGGVHCCVCVRPVLMLYRLNTVRPAPARISFLQSLNKLGFFLFVKRKSIFSTLSLPRAVIMPSSLTHHTHPPTQTRAHANTHTHTHTYSLSGLKSCTKLMTSTVRNVSPNIICIITLFH